VEGIAVRRLESVEQEQAAAVQVAAFVSDPLTRWAYPDAQEYLRRFSEIADILGRQSFDHGTADVGGKFEGVTYWLPAGVDFDFGPLEEYLRGTMEANRRDQLFSLFEQMDGYQIQEPHWHLTKIGVDPARQGQGIGSALMQHRLAACDKEGLPAYLESSNPANLPFYERHGFEVLGEIQAGSSPKLFPMLRSPDPF
jgi:ribosomal protein S18 acetylase RimI-like enzyme